MLVGWLVVGAVLLLFEMRHLAFYALFGALGSFGAAAVALAHGPIALQVVVAIAVAVVGVVTVRPMMSSAFHHRREGGSVARGVHGGIIGQEALTLDQVDNIPQAPGHVRFAGERWLAVSGSDTPIPPDTTVVVTAVSGTTLTVWPVQRLGEAPDGADGRS